MDNVHLLVLKVTLSNENDVSSGHPNLFPHLAANVTEAGHSVEAEAFTATVAKHPDDLGVLLSFLLEFEFTLRLLSISLSPTPIFPSFSCRNVRAWNGEGVDKVRPGGKQTWCRVLRVCKLAKIGDLTNEMSRPTARNLAKQRVLSPREKFETIALTLGFRHGNNVAVPFLSSIQVVAFLIWWAALFVLFMIHKRATEQDDEMVCVRHDLIT